MNIFATSSCPIESARYLDDKRVVKMVLESAQMLSTAINERGGQATYKSTHKNHPCNVWARQTRGNYLWLYYHFLSLCNEYEKRYNKEHRCYSLASELGQGIKLMPEGDRTMFANCARHKQKGIDYSETAPVTEAYKLYLNDRWDTDVRTPSWSTSWVDKALEADDYEEVI